MKEIEKTQSFIFAESAKFAFLHFFIFAFMHLHLVCRFASLPNVHFAKEAKKRQQGELKMCRKRICAEYVSDTNDVLFAKCYHQL